MVTTVEIWILIFSGAAAAWSIFVGVRYWIDRKEMLSWRAETEGIQTDMVEVITTAVQQISSRDPAAVAQALSELPQLIKIMKEFPQEFQRVNAGTLGGLKKHANKLEEEVFELLDGGLDEEISMIATADAGPLKKMAFEAFAANPQTGPIIRKWALERGLIGGKSVQKAAQGSTGHALDRV